MPVKVQNHDGAEDLAVTQDVSDTGASFVSTRQFNVGEEVEMELRFTGVVSGEMVRGRIIWVRPSSAGFCHGVTWSETVSVAGRAPTSCSGNGSCSTWGVLF